MAREQNVNKGPAQREILLPKQAKHNNNITHFICPHPLTLGVRMLILYIYKQGNEPMKYYLPKATRAAIKAEYNNACAACGCADHRSLQIDHAISRKHGGSDELENLQVLCYVCNTQIKRETNTPKMKPRRAEYDCRKWEKGRRAFERKLNQNRPM
jgi:hypothetical protein